MSYKSGSVDDFGVDLFSSQSISIVEYLDRRVEEVLINVTSSEMWNVLSDTSTEDDFVIDVLKEIYLEIVMYQAEQVEGALRAIAQFPRNMPVPLWDEMLHHQVEEFDHGEMAMRDYIGLGGDETFARQRYQSPSAFAVAAIWNHFAFKRDPWLYLGAIYLFEALTPKVSQAAISALRNRKIHAKGFEFISHHATADIEHADQMKSLIQDIIKLSPEKKASIIYGFEYFAHVYPMPCWDSAYRRVLHRRSATPLAAE
jgi:hypothetical protein